MGHYTVFKGSVTGPQAGLDKLKAYADSGHTFSDYEIELSDWFDTYLNGGESMKWYDCDVDCANLSKQYPNLLFEVEGIGEEAGDVWKAWFRNGSSVRVQATLSFDVPDLDELLPLDVTLERKAAEDALEAAHLRVDEAQRELRAALEYANSLVV